MCTTIMEPAGTSPQCLSVMAKESLMELPLGISTTMAGLTSQLLGRTRPMLSTSAADRNSDGHLNLAATGRSRGNDTNYQ